jgi:hypothetical protein
MLFWQRKFVVVINSTKNDEAAQQEAKHIRWYCVAGN